MDSRKLPSDRLADPETRRPQPRRHTAHDTLGHTAHTPDHFASCKVTPWHSSPTPSKAVQLGHTSTVNAATGRSGLRSTGDSGSQTWKAAAVNNWARDSGDQLRGPPSTPRLLGSFQSVRRNLATHYRTCLSRVCLEAEARDKAQRWTLGRRCQERMNRCTNRVELRRE